MKKQPVIIDLSYSFESTLNSGGDLLKSQMATSGHFSYLAKTMEIHVIRLIKSEQKFVEDQVNYHFFTAKKSKLWLPFHIHTFIQSLKPDIILVHGFFKPIQLLLLTFQFKIPIIIQYHGGGVPGGITSLFLKVLRTKIKNYIFTSLAQAEPFIKKGLISKDAKIYEIPEGSTSRKGISKKEACSILKIDHQKTVLIWVGRLNANKDPLTVINGMDKILEKHSNLELLMIYQEDNLIDEVKLFIKNSKNLNGNVKLLGKVDHEFLFTYYSAADFFISGSHSEATGYALFESLACGCKPIVTDIPSFRLMTDNGRHGLLWEVGNSKSLEQAVDLAFIQHKKSSSQPIIEFFEKELSFEAIARKQTAMFEQLIK